MLNQISPAQKPRNIENDAVGLLIGCHQRIRHFTSVATKLPMRKLPSEIRTAEALSLLLRVTSAA